MRGLFLLNPEPNEDLFPLTPLPGDHKRGKIKGYRMKWVFGAKQPNQTKYTIVTSSFRTYVKRPRSLSELIVVAGGDFLEVDFFIVRRVEEQRWSRPRHGVFAAHRSFSGRFCSY